jgi:transposase
LQFGHSKDDPSRPQIKVMTGSLDPLGGAFGDSDIP